MSKFSHQVLLQQFTSSSQLRELEPICSSNLEWESNTLTQYDAVNRSLLYNSSFQEDYAIRAGTAPNLPPVMKVLAGQLDLLDKDMAIEHKDFLLTILDRPEISDEAKITLIRKMVLEYKMEIDFDDEACDVILRTEAVDVLKTINWSSLIKWVIPRDNPHYFDLVMKAHPDKGPNVIFTYLIQNNAPKLLSHVCRIFPYAAHIRLSKSYADDLDLLDGVLANLEHIKIEIQKKNPEMLQYIDMVAQYGGGLYLEQMWEQIKHSGIHQNLTTVHKWAIRNGGKNFDLSIRYDPLGLANTAIRTGNERALEQVLKRADLSLRYNELASFSILYRQDALLTLISQYSDVSEEIYKQRFDIPEEHKLPLDDALLSNPSYQIMAFTMRDVLQRDDLEDFKKLSSIYTKYFRYSIEATEMSLLYRFSGPKIFKLIMDNLGFQTETYINEIILEVIRRGDEELIRIVERAHHLRFIKVALQRPSTWNAAVESLERMDFSKIDPNIIYEKLDIPFYRFIDRNNFKVFVAFVDKFIVRLRKDPELIKGLYEHASLYPYKHFTRYLRQKFAMDRKKGVVARL